MMTLASDERVLTAWAESPRGPGWSNSLVYVLVRRVGGDTRIDCLQMRELSPQLSALHSVSDAVNRAMVAEVIAMLSTKKEAPA